MGYMNKSSIYMLFNRNLKAFVQNCISSVIASFLIPNMGALTLV
jgi:hypothetical protein